MSTAPTRFAILTPNEVEVIKRYVGLAERLETNFGQMKEFAGADLISSNFEKMTGVYSLGADHIISAIVKHATEWPQQEAAIKQLCTELVSTYETFKKLANTLVSTIEQSPDYANYSRTFKQALDQNVENSDSCPVCAEDENLLSSAMIDLGEIIKELGTLGKKAEAGAQGIQKFKESLMNEIQTHIRKFLQLDTVEEMEGMLLQMPINDFMRTLVSNHMGILRGLVVTVLNESPPGGPGNLEETVTSRIHPNHLHEYNSAVAELDDNTRQKIESLVSQTKKGHVLFAQLESLHNWLQIFDKPLVKADQGIGQIRTLWLSTGDELDRINTRAKQVKTYSTLHSIVNSLNAAMKIWETTVEDTKTINQLITRAY
ncbi:MULTISPECIES: hypothetical protein [unclassified Pseudomonas]|uniref:hypothetical protein n=1 Tax=unclassified Pseudomonas TaxID=196821 RepID=UPI001F56052A|nr:MULTISPECIES: hypothetical protein [unclassified Pseudomonas]